ncbi:MAG: IS481 family transposase [Chloroflexi bacterium]|nr:MAG: IS481 family transposase [Chloroflexota bacterium]
MRHPRPRLSEYSRWHLAVLAVDQGWPQVRVAELLRVSRPTVAKWVARYRDQGVAGLRDRSSRPESCPHRTPALVEAQVVAERHRLRLGPDDLAARLGLAPVTVWRVLHRHGCSRLADYDRTHTVAVRYQRERAGELVHIDVKKLGRIPEGGGWRFLGRASQSQYKDVLPKRGRDYLHVAVDDATRVAFIEVSRDEKAASCAAFLEHTHAFFASQGVKVERVLTDRALNYRKGRFVTTAEQLGVGLRRTRPYRPQTNGKAERFIRTALHGWAFAQLYASNGERLAALPAWLDFYNHQRPHRAHRGLSPMTVLVNKVMEDYT